MSITGPEGGAPHKTGVAIADLTTALFSIQGILLALARPRKDRRGPVRRRRHPGRPGRPDEPRRRKLFRDGDPPGADREPPSQHLPLPGVRLLGR